MVKMNKNSTKTVAFMSLGCKVNSYETSSMMEEFKKSGYEIREFNDKADVYVVNTCTVTNIADRKSRQMIHRARKTNPEAIVVACGCYVQAPQSDLENDPLVDILVGTREKADVVGMVESYAADRETGDYKHSVIKTGEENEIWNYEELPLSDAGGRARAEVKIQDGCNQYCSYCIIPFVRGRSRSRDLSSAVNEVRSLVERGFKEIVLTGVHIGSYGKDFDGNEHLTDLLGEIVSIDGDFRVRLGSVEPRLISEDFVKFISRADKICPHFHMSLQSGSDTVLKRMNRHYTTAEFERSVDLLRSYLDRPGITTDIITGFPGETEEEFSETMRFAEKIGFLKVHTFPYSRRTGTYADKMPGQLTEAVKKAREKELMELCDEQAKKYLSQFDGESARLILEEKKGEVMIGHTDRYIEVSVPYSDFIEKNEDYYRKNFIEVNNLTLAKEHGTACAYTMTGRLAK